MTEGRLSEDSVLRRVLPVTSVDTDGSLLDNKLGVRLIDGVLAGSFVDTVLKESPVGGVLICGVLKLSDERGGRLLGIETEDNLVDGVLGRGVDAVSRETDGRLLGSETEGSLVDGVPWRGVEIVSPETDGRLLETETEGTLVVVVPGWGVVMVTKEMDGRLFNDSLATDVTMLGDETDGSQLESVLNDSLLDKMDEENGTERDGLAPHGRVTVFVKLDGDSVIFGLLGSGSFTDEIAKLEGSSLYGKVIEVGSPGIADWEDRPEVIVVSLKISPDAALDGSTVV